MCSVEFQSVIDTFCNLEIQIITITQLQYDMS